MYSYSKYLVIALFIFTGAFRLHSQSNDYRLVAVDFETRSPLANVRVTCHTLDQVSQTTANGEFGWNDLTLDSLDIAMELMGYEKLEMTIHPFNDSLQIVYMFPSPMLLPSIEISALPKVVYSNDTMNVADYAFTKAGMLLLTYEEERRWKRAEEAKVTLYTGCQLVLLDQHNKVVQAASIDEDCKFFYKDYPDEIFLHTRHHILWINIHSDSISFMKVDADDFQKSIEPIVDTMDKWVYYSNYNKEFPAFDYYQYDSVDSTFVLVEHLEDEEMMRMLRSEYKYLTPREKLEAYRFEMETGMDKEVVAAYMRGFQNTHYYEPLNAPMFVHNQGVHIFDHHHHAASQYDFSNRAIAKNEIDHHLVKRPKWLEKVWMDRATGKFYTGYNRNGYTEIHSLSLGTGMTKRMDLTYQFVDFISIQDDFVYYIYRPFESSQNRYFVQRENPLWCKP